MTNKEAEMEDKNPQEEKKKGPKRKQYNFMRSYVEIGVGMIGAYLLLYLFGYFALISLMLFVIIYVVRETIFILESYEYSFVRKASVFNTLHAIGWFVVLVINAVTLIEFGSPLILPQIPTVTNMAPLFILMALFGSRNITAMYLPDKKRS